MVPQGWAVKSLNQLAETALGKMLDRGKSRGLAQVPYLRNVNVQWDRVDTRNLLTMELADDERERFGVRAGDLLVCEGGEVGRAAIWNGRDEYLAYQKALHRIRSRGNLVNRPGYDRDRGGSVRLLRGDNIEPGGLRWDRTRTWPDSLLGDYEDLLISEHDIILAMDRPVISTGLKLAQVGVADLPALLVQRVARIRCGPEVDCRYLYAILQTPQFLAHLREGFVGTQLPHITLQTIRDFTVPLLSKNHQLELMIKLEAQISSFDAARRSVQWTTMRAAGLRRSLLEAAFAGRLTHQDPKNGSAELLLKCIQADQGTTLQKCQI